MAGSKQDGTEASYINRELDEGLSAAPGSRLLNLTPFSNSGFNLGVAVVIIALMTVFSMNMIMPVFMQSSLQFTPLRAAMTLLPACLVSCVLAPIAGKIFDKYGLRFMVPFGMAVIVACVFGLSRCGEGTTSATLIALYAPTIAGCALVIGPAQSYALSRLSPSLYPHGTTIVSTAFQLAGCFGSALFMGVYGIASVSKAAHNAPVSAAAASGFQAACTVAALLTLVGFLLSVALSINSAKTQRRGRHAVTPDVAPADTAGTESSLHTASTAASVMERQVFSVPSTATAYQALMALVDKRTSGMPVLDDSGRLVGFITDGALLRVLAPAGQDTINMAYVYALWVQGKDVGERVKELKDVPVMDIAFRRVHSVDQGASLQEVCATLSDRHIKKVPVTDGDRVVGVINRTELLRSMLDLG